jgi:hypothetical protein
MDEKKILNELLFTFLTVIIMWIYIGLGYAISMYKDSNWVLFGFILITYILTRTFTRPFLDKHIFNN